MVYLDAFQVYYFFFLPMDMDNEFFAMLKLAFMYHSFNFSLLC